MKNINLYTFYLLFIALLIGNTIYAQITVITTCEDDAMTPSYRYWQDKDGDNYGNPAVYTCSPVAVSGFIRANQSRIDCDDNNANIRAARIWYFDSDGDGLGSPTGPTIKTCFQPDRYVDNRDDCNDNYSNIRGKSNWYLDNDKDGAALKNSTPYLSCSDPSTATVKYVTAAYRNDCDDTDPAVIQRTWYQDTDGDGFGETTAIKVQCDKPGDDYYAEALDRCPGVKGAENGCPPAGTYVAELWNTIKVTNYDVTGKKVAQSKAYYDDLGKSVQTQSKDFKTGDTWASQTLYDSQGRPAVQTLSAPIHKDIPADFLYKNGFVKKQNGSTFNIADFENNPEDPELIGTQENTLGWYYSTSNTGEPYQDVTARPYSRTIFSELNPGAALKTIGGNKIDGEWKSGYTFSMPAGQELSSPAAFGDTKYNNYKVIKTVSRDVHGVENVVFTDTDGNTLAAARSGGDPKNNIIRYSDVYIKEQGFVDVHIPAGTQGVTVKNDHFGTLSNNHWFEVYNLITEEKVTTSFNILPSGFYRISFVAAGQPIISVTYPENYYDYSLNYYDKAGHLLSSKQPLNKLESTFNYNSLGQLETTTSPDEGEAQFKYRKDGQIRFSQNSKQAMVGECSYTNYDQLGRPIESGVIENTSFTALDPDAALPSGVTKERHVTQYDIHDNHGLAAAFGSDTRKSNYATQSFVSSNVAKTYTADPETTTTWYSYDIYGRVQWIAQQIDGLSGVKTIDYVYDPITSQVTKVYYQKGAVDQFIHRYTYDPVDYSLVKVETSIDDIAYTEHAAYEYYETGALKRTNIAQGLQGVDYVYNLQGALKSINHPSLSGSNDPGGDANDLFGMMIDYHDHDYNRPLRNIKSAAYGTNQFNGNIKGIRWNSDYNPLSGKEHTYSYQYNRNNWLQQATYGNFTGEYTSTPTISEGGGGGNAEQDYIVSTDIVNSGGTKIYEANRSITMKPGFHAKAGSDVSGKIDGGAPSVRDINAGTLANNANGDYKVDNITYDANGNIQSLDRNKHTENGSNAMDQLSYTYKTDKPNQLLRVDDAAGDVAGADDIGDQNGDNYVYNSIGQLLKNNTENITYIYNASGLVTEVHKDDIPLVKFFYNDKGHRVRKESYNPSNGSLTYTEHYVRDAAGTAMAIYRDGQVIENTLYGSSRLGVRKPDGTHLYQLTDHLGNVRAVIGINPSGQAMALTTATDYYPFGMPMPGRNLQGGYRYAYQGQEKDPETGKEAFELRLWDARIGRWLTTDPYGEFSSPYLGMGNNPISNIDPDGGCISCGISTEDAINIASAVQTQMNTADLGVLNASSSGDFAREFSRNALVFTMNTFGTHANNNVTFGAYQLPDASQFGEYEAAARFGRLAGNLISIGQGIGEDFAAGGAEVVTLGGATVPAVAVAAHGTAVGVAGSVGTATEITGLVNYFSKSKHGKGGFDFKKLSDSLVKSLGLDAHAIKKEFLGNKTSISKYDLYKDNGTGEIWIFLKGGKGEGIPTGYFAN